VYCEPAKVGRSKGWRLLVAIADVSHYVQTGNAIDRDAYDRATSVYFPRRVIPMLPEKLSNGLCSLNPHVERLCMVADMLIDAKGEIQAYQFYPAVMFSHARLTYTQVAEALANTKGPEAAALGERVPDLLNLHDVFRALLQARQKRGAVDLDTVETQIITDDAGRIDKILPRSRNDAHRLIEEAMLAANVCAAQFIAEHKQLGLYRVHDGPTPEKVELLRQYLRALGLNLSVSDEPRPEEFQAISAATHERTDHEQVHTMLLRSMSQAIYSPINDGHFGLAYEAYTHFTSPIRRYPDLLVHRVIKSILQGRPYHLPQLPEPGQAHEAMGKRIAARQQRLGRIPAPSNHTKVRSKKAHTELQDWEAAGLHCSANERRADEASRDVQAWLKCQYMKQFLGEEFSGKVTAVTSFGLFVTLDQVYVEGLIHITELGGEYFRYDEARQELRGERTGTRYSIGTQVQIQVVRVDADARKIDFVLVDELAAYRKDKQLQNTDDAPLLQGKNSHADTHAHTKARSQAAQKGGPALGLPSLRRAEKKASGKKPGQASGGKAAGAAPGKSGKAAKVRKH
jgi:ribonuclease R